MNPVPNPDRLLFVDEVAERMRKTPAALRFMVQKGTAPNSALIGGRRMWKSSVVEAWIEEQFDKSA